MSYYFRIGLNCLPRHESVSGALQQSRGYRSRVAQPVAATGTATGIRVSLNTGFTVANSGFDSNAVLPVHGIVLR